MNALDDAGGLRPTQEFPKQIACMLRELMDEQRDVCELMSGRTFARTIH
jgi:hypothetical protein